MPGYGKLPLFKGAVANGETKYVGWPIHEGILGGQIAWLDATSSATLTIELTSFNGDDAPVESAGSAWEWADSGETITGPTAAAAGSTLIHFENVRQKFGRLKIVGAAASSFEIYDGGG